MFLWLLVHQTFKCVTIHSELSKQMRPARLKSTWCSWRPTRRPAALWWTYSCASEKSTSWGSLSRTAVTTSSTRQASSEPKWRATSQAYAITSCATTCDSMHPKWRSCSRRMPSSSPFYEILQSFLSLRFTTTKPTCLKRGESPEKTNLRSFSVIQTATSTHRESTLSTSRIYSFLTSASRIIGSWWCESPRKHWVHRKALSVGFNFGPLWGIAHSA